MIKILHLADLHLGVENYGRVDPETGLHSRLLDYLARKDLGTYRSRIGELGLRR